MEPIYTYKKFTIKGIEQPMVVRIEDNTFIPFDDTNNDYKQYQSWLSEGNEPLPSDEPYVSE